MRALEICSAFLSLRLSLNLREDEINRCLCDFLELPNRSFLMNCLMQKFQKNEHLINILGSWMGAGPRELLTEHDVMNLFGKERLEYFASQLNVSRQSLAIALAEMLPAIIARHLLTEGAVIN